jgi:HlyD family secretion protein
MKSYSLARLGGIAVLKARSAFQIAALVVLGAAGCKQPPSAGWQGYLEGEFVHIGAPLAGRVETLAVQKGTRVDRGAILFTLEHASELAAQREAGERLRSSQARLSDLRKGLRPTELTALEARIEQARAASELSRRELDRASELIKSGAIATTDYDRARLTHDRNIRAVDEFVAQIATARLGGRSDVIAAAEAEVAAAMAAKERADWAVSQKTQTAPKPALVYDTLFREGEYVTAGAPIVSLLPAENLKVRFFVPESQLAGLKMGDRLQVSMTGRPAPIEARVNYLSPRPEYTPPVLYNRDNRAKLVFMVEASTDPTVARELHPGQPVDVSLAR